MATHARGNDGFAAYLWLFLVVKERHIPSVSKPYFSLSCWSLQSIDFFQVHWLGPTIKSRLPTVKPDKEWCNGMVTPKDFSKEELRKCKYILYPGACLCFCSLVLYLSFQQWDTILLFSPIRRRQLYSTCSARTIKQTRYNAALMLCMTVRPSPNRGNFAKRVLPNGISAVRCFIFANAINYLWKCTTMSPSRQTRNRGMGSQISGKHFFWRGILLSPR